MTKDEMREFVREVIASGSSLWADGVDAQVEKIVDKWDDDQTETWNRAVAEGRAAR